MSSTAQSQHLTDFFDPSIDGTDPHGRTLTGILGWSDDDLEYSHDYIQNVFPLPEGSMFNHAIWLVTPQVYHVFRQRPELRKSLEAATVRICRFYGLEIANRETNTSSDIVVSRGRNFQRAQRRWLVHFNHNHLRITRVLRSLRVLGLESHCSAFHSFLTTDEDVKARVSARSQMYWERAATRPLRLPPDEDDESAGGIAWLAELEK